MGINGYSLACDNEASRVISWHPLNLWYKNARFLADIEEAKVEWADKREIVKPSDRLRIITIFAPMRLYIKNMVCQRCILVVKQELEKLKLQPLQVVLGEVDLAKLPTGKQLGQLNEQLIALGFELLDDQKKKHIESVKNLIIQKVQQGDIEEHFSLSKFLTKALHKEYAPITRLFSEVEGITIEQFFILQRIEKVKEWLFYNELTLSEITWTLGYSSVAHLSAQFKKVTGLTPSAFKKMGGKRKSIDNL
jgi:AraC family transcriptional regulator